MIIFKDIFFIGIVGATFIGGIICAIYLISGTIRHRNRKNNYLDSNITNKEFSVLVQRNYEYILSFLGFQTVGKYVEIMAILFSLGAFTYNSFDMQSKLISSILSIASIVLVVISIYLNPKKRAKEYIIAWRKSDKLVNEIIEKNEKLLPTEHEDINVVKELQHLFSNIPITLDEIENDIKSDEE